MADPDPPPSPTTAVPAETLASGTASDASDDLNASDAGVIGDGRPRITIAFGPSTVLLVLVVTVVTAWIIRSLHATVGMVSVLALSATLAVLLRPAALVVARRMRLGLAIAVVLLASLLVGGFVAFGGAMELAHSTNELAARVPEAVDRFPEDSTVGRFLRESKLADRAVDGIKSVPNRIIFGSDSPEGGLGRLATIVLAVTTSFMFITRGRNVVAGATGLFRDPGRAERAFAVARAAFIDGGSYTGRLIVLALVQGAIAGSVAVAVGLPAPIAVGIFVGSASLLPGIGLAFGWIPLITLAAAQDLTDAGLCAAGLVVAAVIYRIVYRRWVQRPASGVGLVLPAVGFIVGYQLAGIPGTVTGLLVAAMASAGLAELGGITGLTAWIPSEDDEAAALQAQDDRAAVRRRPIGGATVLADLSVRSVLMAAAIVIGLAGIGIFVFDRPGFTVALVVALVLALALNPMVDLAQRLTRDRGAAVALVLVGLLVPLAAFAVLALPATVSQFRSLDRETPQVVNELTEIPVIGGAIERAGLADEITQAIDDAPETLAADTSSLGEYVRSFGDVALITVITLILLLCFLLDGPRFLAQVHGAVPGHHQHQAERLGDIGYRAFGRFFGGKALTAIMDGIWVTSFLLVFRVPLAPVLGVWAALTNLIPQIGGLLGGVVIFVFALTQGIVIALVCTALFVAFMTLENNAISPVIIGKAVNLSPLAATVVMLLGAAAGGVLGAIIATPLAGVVKIAYHEFRPTPAPVPAVATSGDDPPDPATAPPEPDP